jgi:hypothetical protein
VNDAIAMSDGTLPHARCGLCGGKSIVTDTRPWHASIKRRRKCQSCDYRWTTIEVPYDLAERLPDLETALTRLSREADVMASQVSAILRHLP